MQDVGQRIKQARLQMGLSQSALANQTRVSQPTVANWEKGSHAPRHAALEKIATALGATPAWLITGDNDAARFSPNLASDHHVPLLDWPQDAAALDQGQVQEYIAATTQAKRPIALIAPSHSGFGQGATLIFDRAQTEPVRGSVYLIENDAQVTLLEYNSSEPLTGTVLARLVMSLQAY